MYAIEKITRQVNYWSEVMHILEEIGSKGGLDYGVRPWGMWGNAFPANVFEWRSTIDAINERLTPNYSAEEYQQTYAKEKDEIKGLK